MNKPTDLQGLVLDPITGDQRYIGHSEPRHSARRLLQGQGTYIDDLQFPRMGHVVYWRSPVAHMKIGQIHTDRARKMPGVIAIVDGVQMATICKPWVATLGHLAGMKSAPEYALAVDRACWQGEPVVAVVAETRAKAEDALAHVEVEWEELPAVVSMETALDKTTPVIHPELGDNLCFTRTLDVGKVDEVFKSADVTAEATFGFGRHTGVTLETRCQIADFNPGEKRLTVYHSQQAPHMMQDLYCRQFGLAESDVAPLALRFMPIQMILQRLALLFYWGALLSLWPIVLSLLLLIFMHVNTVLRAELLLIKKVIFWHSRSMI